MNNYSFTKSYIRNPNKKIILVVDDDKSIRFILRKLLEKNGYEVETTGNYIGLLRLIKQISPDLLITDIRLPDGNVLNNIPEIKKIYPSLPIIVISAFSSLETTVNSLKLGAFEYLSKPFDIQNILKVVRSVFDLPKTISKKKIISEGGLAGHMMHPYEALDMTPRQNHKSFEAGGVKVRVLGQDSNDFKFKFKNKK